ncbi:NAD(P)-dependent oxidoreductase [Streptomyces sp. NPDC002276]
MDEFGEVSKTWGRWRPTPRRRASIAASNRAMAAGSTCWLPRGATFINTARGALVDEAALIRVLRERPDLFAILDVTWPEPPAPGSPLYGLSNVLLTGHTAGSTGSENHRMGQLMADELIAFADGRPLHHTITAEQARTRA